MTSHQGARLLAWLSLGVLALASSSVAQITTTWQVPGVASWNDPINWDTGVPMAAGDHAVFGPLFPTADTTVLVADPTTTVGTLTYNNPFVLDLFAPTLTFDGNGSAALIDIQDGQLLFNNGSLVLASDLDLSVAPGSSASVGIGFTPAASLTGPGGLNVLGGGDVILNGANTYGGATHIRSGVLTIAKNNSLGASTGTDADATYIHSGGTLRLGSTNVTLPDELIVFDGGTIQGASGGEDWLLAGPVRLDSGQISGGDWRITGNLTVNGGSLTGLNWSVQGPVTLNDELTVTSGLGIIQSKITGAGGMTVDAPGGTLRLTQANDYTGPTLVRDGSLLVTNDLALGAGTGTDADGTAVLNNGKLIIGAGRRIANEKINLLGGTVEGISITLDAPIRSEGGVLSVSNATINSDIELAGDLTIRGSALRSNTFGQLSGSGGLTVDGGVVDIRGTGTYTGTTRLTGNTELTLWGAASLGTGPIVVESGELWSTRVDALNNSAITVHGDGELVFLEVPTQTVNLTLEGGRLRTITDITISGQIELAQAQSTIGSTGSDDLRLEADMFGTGDLRYAGGTIILPRGYAYTGLTTIDGGIVRIQHTDALGGLGAGTVINNGTLSLDAPTHESLMIRGGEVIVQANSSGVTGPITMSGGELLIASDNTPYGTHIALEPGHSTFRARDVVFTGGTSGVGDMSFTLRTTVDGAPLAHDGAVETNYESVTFNTPNNYTGLTTIRGGGLTVNHPGALGTSDERTIVEGGQLTLNVVPNEDIEIRDGSVEFNDSSTPYLRTLTLNANILRQAAVRGTGIFEGPVVVAGPRGGGLGGGTFNGTISGDGRFSVGGSSNEPVTLNGANTYTSETMVYGLTHVNNPLALGTTSAPTIVSTGTLALNVSTEEFIALERYGAIELNAQQPRMPEILEGATGTIRFNTPSQYNERVMLKDAQLQVNADTSLSGIVVNGAGRIMAAPGATLNVADHQIIMYEGALEAPTTGLDAIHKRTSGQATIGDMPGFDGRIELDKGLLMLKQDAVGPRATAGIFVNDPDRAYILLEPDLVLPGDVQLNDSQGIHQAGALRARKFFSSRQATPEIHGALHLGDQGSFIGGDTIILKGPITGGSLTMVGEDARLVIENGANTYTGVTDIRGAGIQLLGQGRLTQTERIIVHHDAFLSTDNRDVIITDRVADHIPIELRGGSVGITAATGVSTSETFGELILASGRSSLDADDDTARSFTFASLTHLPGAMFEFERRHQGRYYFHNPPALTHGLIGGWATVIGDGQSGFAGYDPVQGVVLVAPNSQDINAAGPSDNVLTVRDNDTLLHDATVNSLILNGDLDLTGHTLRIATGGVLTRISFSEITNGFVTVGNGNGGTLYSVLGEESPDVASIVDDGDGVVSLVVGGGYIGGVNTYSGSTTVNRGTLHVITETALPTGTDITIDSGKIVFDYFGTSIRQFGTLRLREDATLQEGFGSGSVALDFEALELEEGTIERVELAGSGTIRKTTPGTVSLELNDSPDYHGAIEVYDGVLATRSYDPAGTSPITIYGGMFVQQTRSGVPLVNPITLAGGTLGGIDDAEFSSNIFVSAPSTIETLGGRLEINGNISGDASLAFDQQGGDPRNIVIAGDNSGFSGPVDILGGFVRVVRDAPAGLGNGSITLHPGARLLWEPISGDLDLRLAGGEFNTANKPTTLTGRLDVLSDSYISSLNEDYALVLETETILRDGVRLSQTKNSSMAVGGELRVGHGVSLYVQEGTLRLQGKLIPDVPEASLDLVSGAFGQIEFVPDIELVPGRSLSVTVNGHSVPLVLNTPGQSVTGSGTIAGSIVLAGGTVMAPGHSAGSILVDGDYTQTLNAIMQIELGGTSLGGYDRLGVTGLFHAGGTFELLLIDDFMPGPADVFDVLDFDSIIPGSAFDQLLLPALPTGREWDTSDLLVTGEIRVVPEPGCFLLFVICLILLPYGRTIRRPFHSEAF